MNARVEMMMVALLCGCPSAPPLPGDTDTDAEDTEAGDETEGETTSGPSPNAIQLGVNEDVDILFVIDNTGSMGEEQLALAAAFPVFVDALEAMDANYRIAITTTDNGNHWCTNTTPEAGNFVFSSCRERLGDFLFAPSMVDATDACTQHCPAEWSTITQTPTTIDESGEAAPRPWIERNEGTTNLANGLAPAQALQCLGPQGIAGCGFEQHLESMYLALRRATTVEENEFGFMRDNAVLAIVFATDEEDCSDNPEWETIFYSDADGGNEVFWSLPDENSPTSAVCWNAGVTCEPQAAAVYDECHAADKDFEGNEISDGQAEADAVLHPIARYTDFLDEIEAAKQTLSPAQEVLVTALLGVPENFPSGPIVYARGADPTVPGSFQANFGIAPGCVSPMGEAVPPVRVRELAEHFMTSEDDVNLFSICRTSYDDSMAAIANAIDDQLRPSCMRACVADDDPVVQGLQPDCTLTQSYRDENNQLIEDDVPPCEAGDTVPDGAELCHVLLTDPGGSTPDTADDMDDECVDEGWNLEFRIVRDAPAPAGLAMSAECTLSQNKAVDCPGLPS